MRKKRRERERERERERDRDEIKIIYDKERERGNMLKNDTNYIPLGFVRDLVISPKKGSGKKK